MFRPGRYAPQYRHGASGSPVRGHPGMMNGPRPFPHPVIHGRGPLIAPPPFPGGQQQPLGFGPPAMLPHVSRTLQSGFSPASMPSAPNQGTLFSVTPLGTVPSRPQLEPHHFVGPRGPLPGPPLPGPPPRLPPPPRASFVAPLPLGPPTDAPPPPPSFSPLPLPPPPVMEFCQPTPSSHTQPLHLPPPPPLPMTDLSQPLLPAAEVSKPPPPTVEVSQPPPPTIEVPQSSPPSHSLSMHTPPQMPNDEEMVPNIGLHTPPQMPNDEEVVQNIEILAQFVVENGPEFENMARVKQADNPKFSFLFDGTPGSDAAIGFKYFQWMKKKWELQMKMGQEAEDQGQCAEPLELPKDSQQGTGPSFAVDVASTSPTMLDMDMDEVCPELAFEGPRVEDLSPVQSSPIELQQTTDIDEQVAENEGLKPSTSIEEPPVESNATVEKDALPKNYEELIPADLVCDNVESTYANDGIPEMPVFDGNNTGDSLTNANVESEEIEGFKPSHVSKDLSESSDNSKDRDLNVSENNDVTREPDHEMFDEEAPAKQEEEEVESLTKEGASDSESDGVLYTGKEIKKAHSRSRSRSPRDRRFRSHSRTPGRGSRSRSPRGGGDTKGDEERKKRGTGRLCFHFASGTCHWGSSCRFLHQKDTVDNAGEQSGGGSGKGRGSIEKEQEIKESMGGVERSVVVEDIPKNPSLSRDSDGHGSPISREKKKEGADTSEDSYASGKGSPECDAHGVSEPQIQDLERGIFRPPLPHREDIRTQPLSREEFRPVPLPREEFRPLPLPREEFRPRPLAREEFRSLAFPREDFRPLPFPRVDVRLQPLPREDLRPQFPRREDFHVHLLPREDVHSLSLLRRDIRTVPLSREDIRTQSFIREGVHTQSSHREDLHTQPLLRDNLRSQTLLRGGFHDQPLLRDDLRTPSLVREEFRPVHLRSDFLSQPLPRGDLRFPEEDLRSQSLLREDLRFRHLLREDSRFRAEDLRSREDLHPKLFSREDIRFQALDRDFPSRRLDGSMGRFDPLVSGNSSIHQNSALPVNLSLLSHVNFTNNPDPLRPGHPLDSSSLDQSAKLSFLGGHLASSPHSPFPMNPKSVPLPGFLSSMQDPAFTANPSAGMPSTFKHHSSLHSISTSEPFSLQHSSDSKQGFFDSRTPSVPPLSPPNISRVEAQFLPKRMGSMPFDFSEEWQTHRYSHPGGPSMPGPTSPHRPSELFSGSGGQYDPLYDSIEPTSRGNEAFKFFEFGGGEDNHANVTVMESETAARLENVNPGHDGGKIATGRLSQPQNVLDNNRHKVEADCAVEAAMDAEVGVVDNESPGLEEGRDWTPGHRLEVATACAGEVDVDQTHPNDKTRNIKEIRTMKIFRTALAEFVKELLKPTWREGHMSKESFKTIVKKAVDKVAGTLQSHQIPNTQERIDQYLESSRLKLTKLVEGYVDKYGKS